MRSLALRASASTAPALRPAALRGTPAEVKAALILPGDINIEVAKPDVRAQEARPWREGRLTEDMLRGGPRKGRAVAKPAEEQHTEERPAQARPVWW